MACAPNAFAEVLCCWVLPAKSRAFGGKDMRIERK
jgi:hypothetical protein